MRFLSDMSRRDLISHPAVIARVQHSSTESHRDAALTFSDRVRDAYGDRVDRMLLYGSVARDEVRGSDSDVDLLIILRDEVDTTSIELEIRDVAYDVELEYGVILSLVFTTVSDFKNNTYFSYFSRVREDAQTLYG